MQTINSMIDEFIIYLEAKGDRGRTIEIYRWHLNCLAEIGTLDKLSPARLDRVIAELRKHLAMATIAGHIQAIRSFCAWLVRRHYLVDNPALDLKRPDTRHNQKLKAIKQTDLEQMIEVAGKRGLALERALLLLLADTGCRAGELCGLDLEDVDLVRMEAQCDGKTGPGLLDFTGATADALRTWLMVRPETDPKAFFTTRRGRISYARVYDSIETLAHGLGIERHNPHSIHHRVGQGWIDQGANLELVRLKLRHRDISTTAMTYGNQDRGRIKQATRRYSLIKK